MNVPFGSFVLPESSFFSLPILKLASANSPSRWLRTRKFFDSALTALVPTPFKPDAELEHVVIVFRAGVDLGNAVHDFAQRNAAPEIAHGHAVAFDVDLHFLAVAHDEFVNGVIHDFLEQDVAAVVGIAAVADAPDVHARAQPDVLQRGQRLDFALVVNCVSVFQP